MKVHVCIYEHRAGLNVSVHATKELAAEARRETAEEWWEEEMKDAPKPEDRDEAADLYFATVVEAFYIEEREVEGAVPLWVCDALHADHDAAVTVMTPEDVDVEGQNVSDPAAFIRRNRERIEASMIGAANDAAAVLAGLEG